MKKWLRQLLSVLRGEQRLNKLINRGLKVGKNFKMMGGCIIDPSHCWHIEIGENVILAPRVHILAHDASTGLFLHYTKIGNVSIGNNVFIGANSTVLLGVTISDNVIIGAGSIVTKSIPSNSVAAGNPARVISSLDDYLMKEKGKMNENNVFGEEYTLRNKNLSESQKKKMIESCKEFQSAYIE
jgi:maltose O-acetyltransferase